MIERHRERNAAYAAGLHRPLRRAVEGYMMERPIALFCLLILAVGCYLVLKPFLSALLWGIIFTISTWPLHVRLTRALGGRMGASAAILTLATVGLLVVPLALLGLNLSENVQELVAAFREWRTGGFPPPPSWVETMPLAGPRLHQFWADLAGNSAEAMATLTSYLQMASRRILDFGVLLGSGLVHICISLALAFVFYRNGHRAVATFDSVMERLAGREGARLRDVTVGTLKGVVYGIIGTNLVEAILATIGFWIAGVPGPLLLGFFCFFLTLVPAGPTLIWLPAALWLFAQDETAWAIFLIVWNIIVFSIIEAFLRAVLVSRGSELPMVLIFLGLFGGLLTFGFLGLFLGPCLLALGYTLIGEWSGAERVRRKQVLKPSSALSQSTFVHDPSSEQKLT